MTRSTAWWRALYLRHAFLRDLLAVACVMMLAALTTPLWIGGGAKSAGGGPLPTGTLLDAPPADDAFTPSAVALPPESAPHETPPSPPPEAPHPADSSNPVVQQTRAEESAAGTPPDEAPAESPHRPTDASTQEVVRVEQSTSLNETKNPTANDPRLVETHPPMNEPMPNIAETSANSESRPATPSRPEIVEAFEPGRQKPAEELRNEQQEVAKFERRLHDGKFRLVVDLSPLSREELTRVCAAFRFQTSNRTLFLDPAGRAVNAAERGRNQLVGDRPDMKRVPQAAADRAAEILGPYHKAAIACLFTDECALTLYRALARAIDTDSLRPGETLELQLRPAPNGRVEAAVITTPGRPAPVATQSHPQEDL